MNIVSFGGGTNSTAMIIGMYQHKIPIDLILFADTGGEQPHTYAFIETFNRWLVERGLPEITIVQYYNKYGDRLTLEQECINSGTLPSTAYGFKRCSLKHKIGTQDKYCILQAVLSVLALFSTTLFSYTSSLEVYYQ